MAITVNGRKVKPGGVIENLYPFEIRLARNVEAEHPRPYLVIDKSVLPAHGSGPLLLRACASLTQARRHMNRYYREWATTQPEVAVAQTEPSWPAYRVTVEYHIRCSEYAGADSSPAGACALVADGLAGRGVDLPEPTRITAKEV